MNSTCPVKEPEGIFDPVNKRILVYGDANNKSQVNYNLPAAFELWEYKNNIWKKLSTDGPDITGSRMISFDAEKKRLVVPVFERNKMTVWEWTGNEWVKIIFETIVRLTAQNLHWGMILLKKILSCLGVYQPKECS